MANIDLRITDKIAWLLSKPKRIKIAVGGRGSSKSIGVGDIMLMLCDSGERICCTREFQNSIDDSVHEGLKQSIARLGVEGINTTKNNINSSSGGEIFYKGLARNITSLKSIAGVSRLWIEEGESVSKNSLSVLTPSVRSGAGAFSDSSPAPEIWITMNRGSSEDAIAKKYLSRAEDELARCGYYEDDLIMVVEVNYTDNPWFPPELEQERADDKENLSEDEYDHIWGGQYNDTVENAIIKKAWFDAAIDSHLKLGIKPTGATVVSFDPADTGGDSKGYAQRKGILYEEIDEIIAENGNVACDIATSKAIQANADLFAWDGDGMGALLREQIATSFKGVKCELRMYRGSNEVEDKKAKYAGLHALGTKDKPKTNADMFNNKRSQYYTKLAQRFYNTYRAVTKTDNHPNGEYMDPDSIISISSDIKLLGKLRAEVCRIPRKPNGSGKIQIMSKKEMKDKYHIESPGMADCLAMGEEIPELAEEAESLQFDSLWG
jgi:phage terminase large subunit